MAEISGPLGCLGILKRYALESPAFALSVRGITKLVPVCGNKGSLNPRGDRAEEISGFGSSIVLGFHIIFRLPHELLIQQRLQATRHTALPKTAASANPRRRAM
jgi:hypothetical protein